tara:strand:+ start:547 stop:807 length:261 start_codon:yes stop_codon:yes gene_type:complete
MAKKKQPKKRSKDFDIDEYREAMVTSLTVLKNDVRHIKETMVDQRTLLREQNGRISKAEATLGWLKGIGTIFIATFSTIFAWFFNK